MIAIEQNIETFCDETDKSVDFIIRGSDDHLDLILSVTKPLNEMTVKFQDFNEYLYNEINKYSAEQLQEKVIPRLWQLNKSCLALIGAIKTSFLYKDVRTALKEYTKQHDFLREILHDNHHFKMTKDDELDDILKELNAM